MSSSVADPDPPDPHVFPGSGSIIQRYGSGSLSKHSKKTLHFHRFVNFFDILSLKNEVNAPSKSNMQKNFEKKLFFVGVLRVNDENIRIRI
jgi:hypothetical protein